MNQRSQPRFPSDLAVAWRPVPKTQVLQALASGEEGGFLAGRALNMSAEGLLLHSTSALTQGSLYKLKLGAPETLRKQKALAQCMWCEASLGDPGWVSGLKLITVFGETDQDALGRFLSKAKV